MIAIRNLDFLKTRIIAHRGYHDKKYPENSISAFKKSIRYGYNIELDVHLTKDEKLVVFHDNNLKRMCKIDKCIEDLTYDELLKYNLLDTKYKIPLLSEVLSLINGQVGLLIETKVIKFNGKLEEKLSDMLDNYNGDFAVQSFNPLTISWFKKNRKNYLRGILLSDFNKHNISNLKKWILKTLILDIFLKVDFIGYDLRALPSKYIENKRKLKPVFTWTIRTKQDYEKAVMYSDNIIAENMHDYL